MKITVTIGNDIHPASETGDRLVVERLGCPKCHRLVAVIDAHGTVVALHGGSEDAHDKAVASAMADKRPGPFRRVAPDFNALLMVRMPRPVEDERGWSGAAECCRCRQDIGTVRVDLDTMWGRTEDRAVLQGRPRVY